MSGFRFDAWRACFAAAALLILIGGPMHPAGPMVAMLAHPDWLMSHVLVTTGFALLFAGLLLFGKNGTADPGLRRWTRYAGVLTGLQTLEGIVHTAAMVDAAHLAAGHATPVLTTHMALALVVQPLFGAAMVGFIAAATRARAAGSIWIAWLGIVGAAGHGLAVPLTLIFGDPARVLFPLVVALALWLLLAAVWPARAGVRSQAPVVSQA